MRSLALDDLLIPSTERVVFHGPRATVAVFTLTSNCPIPVAFLVHAEASDEARYRVMPAQGVLSPDSAVAIHVEISQRSEDLDTTMDIIRVFSTWVEDPKHIQEDDFWEKIDETQTRMHNLAIELDDTPLLPASVSKMVCKIPSVGDTWLNGLSNEYDAEFPKDLAPYMMPADFESAMKLINEALIDHWPCVPCYAVGYGCCICTGGLSLYCSWSQVKEAEDAANRQIQRINRRPCFQDRNITWSLKRIWYTRTSYVEITMLA
ncbi:hypothetical protein THRCLA_09945 [Thraustotheca clavata]|uniref:MSP domain-containing protein n=1 Tax=Thraustotheca clavata TaxID=74557 RepID=A0A1V9YTG8_9STRA|nr:hypothetical protein THRCLA_09945 [Thraustotheca clavata]